MQVLRRVWMCVLDCPLPSRFARRREKLWRTAYICCQWLPVVSILQAQPLKDRVRLTLDQHETVREIVLSKVSWAVRTQTPDPRVRIETSRTRTSRTRKNSPPELARQKRLNKRGRIGLAAPPTCKHYLGWRVLKKTFSLVTRTSTTSR
jgi:hypothetical protein